MWYHKFVVISLIRSVFLRDKGNNKITEHRVIFQSERRNLNQQTDKISQQPENWENHNGTDFVQAFSKKWWVESYFTAPNLPLPLWLKQNSQHLLKSHMPEGGVTYPLHQRWNIRQEGGVT